MCDKAKSVKQYRALNLHNGIIQGISTRGFFIDVDDLQRYIICRDLDRGKVLRVEIRNGGIWEFVCNISIPHKY